VIAKRAIVIGTNPIEIGANPIEIARKPIVIGQRHFSIAPNPIKIAPLPLSIGHNPTACARRGVGRVRGFCVRVLTGASVRVYFGYGSAVVQLVPLHAGVDNTYGTWVRGEPPGAAAGGRGPLWVSVYL
jgi:hypothetical protein